MTAIRVARVDDAAAISALIARTLREVNSRDYAPAIIEDLVRSYAPDRIVARLAERTILVALEGDTIVGTAGFDGAAVRSVFVRPDRHGAGIGAHLVADVEALARARGLRTLTVPSSLTAVPFYRRLGYATVREHRHGDELTIIMEKPLAAG
jgi:GNAT superfamily N-acetyltransferase